MNVNSKGIYNVYVIVNNDSSHTFPQDIYVNNNLVDSRITNNGTGWSRISFNVLLNSGNNKIKVHCSGASTDFSQIFWSLNSDIDSVFSNRKKL
jgi:hypothetical protein